jgi:protein TonB
MSPIANEAEAMNGAANASKAQPAAMELAVTVNGARTVEGTDKREPFSESTQTVLVFATGAVIRMASAVAPGQLLFLTNDKTKKEVVCQVVKAKSQAGANGYVELEFTEPAPGFWGIKAPGALNGAMPMAAKPLAAPPTQSLTEKLAQTQSKAATPAADTNAKSAEQPAKAPVVVAPVVVAPVKPVVVEAQAAIPVPTPVKTAAAPTAERKEIPAASVVPARPSAEPKVPTLSEFLTQGESGSELKRNNTPAPPASAHAESKKPNGAATEQKTLTAALVDHLAKPAPLAGNPAPGSITFDFEAEEVKIPSWLEPLAKNGSQSANGAAVTAEPIAKPEFSKPATVKPEAEPEVREAKAPIAAAAEIPETRAKEAEYSDKPERVLELSSEGPTPNFGTKLAIDSSRAEQYSEPGGSKKGLVLTIVAVLILLAAAGAWYWYTSQTANASGNAAATVEPNAVAPSAASSIAPRSAANSTEAVAQPVSNNADLQPAQIGSNNGAWKNVAPAVTPALKANTKSSETANYASEELKALNAKAAEPAKPSLGKVHLAAPTAKRSATDGETSEPEPAIGGMSGGDANAMGLLANKSKQPAAPLPVGGDVKQARLLSAVPPIYPPLARTQHVAGNVVVDALIDANGKVTTMKVVSGPALLHQAAMDALRQWKYQPATLNGQAMAMHLSVTIEFKLQQ